MTLCKPIAGLVQIDKFEIWDHLQNFSSGFDDAGHAGMFVQRDLHLDLVLKKRLAAVGPMAVSLIGFLTHGVVVQLPGGRVPCEAAINVAIPSPGTPGAVTTRLSIVQNLQEEAFYGPVILRCSGTRPLSESII